MNINKVSEIENNFIGFTDKYGTTIQFYVDDIDKIKVEIPIPAEGGSYGSEIKKTDMVAIIKTLREPYIKYKKSLNLKFLAW